MRWSLVVLIGCAAERSPYAIVEKSGTYERHMYLDGDFPAHFTVTMETFDGAPGSIFVREYRDGAWWSSSPSPGTFVYGEPRIEPGCDDCHAQHAETIGMFSYHLVGRGTVTITCEREPTEPCDAATYR